jgi:hypothetical protein
VGGGEGDEDGDEGDGGEGDGEIYEEEADDLVEEEAELAGKAGEGEDTAPLVVRGKKAKVYHQGRQYTKPNVCAIYFDYDGFESIYVCVCVCKNVCTSKPPDHASLRTFLTL